MTEVRRRERSPILHVLSLPSFRRYWFAQLGVGLVNGTVRFALVWLVMDLTDWRPAIGLVGLVLGLPAMVLTLPAGALSDRLDRVRIVVIGSLLAGCTLLVLAAAIWVELVAIWLVMVAALLVGGTHAVIQPAAYAIVPALVPPERLMTGVALQGMSQNIAQVAGTLVGGAAITLAGTGGAMVALGAISLGSAMLISGVRLPKRPAPDRPQDVLAETLAGMRFAMGHEPLRSLLAIGVVVSGSWALMQLILPDLLRSTMQQDAFAASAVFGALAAGMFLTTVLLANREHLRCRGLVVALPLTAIIGSGVIATGLSRAYALTFGIMFMWGIAAGLVMTLQRTLIQEATPEEYMGRLMGCNAFALNASYPLAAAAAAGATAAFGGSGALVVLGVGVFSVASLVAWRPAIRRIQ